MVGVAQSVELWIVAPAVAGSNPVAHPISPLSFFFSVIFRFYNLTLAIMRHIPNILK